MRFGLPAALRGLCGGAERLASPGNATLGGHSITQFDCERNNTHTPVLSTIVDPTVYGSANLPLCSPTVQTDLATGAQGTLYSGASSQLSALDRRVDTKVSTYSRQSANRKKASRVDATTGNGYGHGQTAQARGRYEPYRENARFVDSSKASLMRIRTRQPALGRWNNALDLELTPPDSSDSGNTLFDEQKIYEVFPQPEVKSSRYADTQTIERGMDDLSLSGSRRLEYDTLGRPYGFAQSPPSSPMPPPSPPSSREGDDVLGPYIPSPVQAVRKKSQSYKGYYLELPDLDTDSGSDSDSLDSDDGDSFGGGGIGRRYGCDKFEQGPRPHSRPRKAPRSTLTDIHVVGGETYDRYADKLDHAREEFAWRHGWY